LRDRSGGTFGASLGAERKEMLVESTDLSLVCQDLPAGAQFFRDVMALPVRQRDPRHVEVQLPDRTAHLTPPPDRASDQPYDPATSQANGVILKIEVPDVAASVAELRARGADILVEPVLTEWGTESAFVAGPDACVIELYRSRNL
jgi:catechol 2,3-dioxygenase-like lactoylglutathione lyase family enzyme